MTPSLKRILRVVFAVAGSLTLLLGIAVVTLAVVLRPPDATGRALIGSLLYFGMAGTCFYAWVRLSRSGPAPGVG